MPDVCCAVGCTNRRNKEIPGLKFYRLPSTKSKEKAERREKWIAAIHRDHWPEKAMENARLCSAHFVTGISLSVY